ncbi:hypothetical protein GCM10023320_34420 [Pseudonocardia adelaidensis]|uniref:Uncharacterized protein n=1 Tax=Pseudonocardia adelaidensis TaxID=648754 RepID=A0ABP9NK11_9PSEU
MADRLADLTLDPPAVRDAGVIGYDAGGVARQTLHRLADIPVGLAVRHVTHDLAGALDEAPHVRGPVLAVLRARVVGPVPRTDGLGDAIGQLRPRPRAIAGVGLLLVGALLLDELLHQTTGLLGPAGALLAIAVVRCRANGPVGRLLLPRAVLLLARIDRLGQARGHRATAGLPLAVLSLGPRSSGPLRQLADHCA